MDNREQIQEQVTSILRQKTSVDVAATDDDLIDAGVLDSLTFVELILEIESRFSLAIDIAEMELDDLRSVEKIVEFVARQRVA